MIYKVIPDKIFISSLPDVQLHPQKRTDVAHQVSRRLFPPFGHVDSAEVRMVVVLHGRIRGIGRRAFAESVKGEEEGGETAGVDTTYGDLSGFDGDELCDVEISSKVWTHERFGRNIDDVQTVSNVTKRFRFETKTFLSKFYVVRRIFKGDFSETVAVIERSTSCLSYSLRERYAF